MSIVQGPKSNKWFLHLKLDLQGLGEYIDSVLGFSGLVNWLCSEAYYTNFAVYAIVISLQLGYDGDDFNPNIWLVAAIENLADLIKHMLHEVATIPSTAEEDVFKKLILNIQNMIIEFFIV